MAPYLANDFCNYPGSCLKCCLSLQTIGSTIDFLQLSLAALFHEQSEGVKHPFTLTFTACLYRGDL